AMMDEDTLTIGYRHWRGEPRGKLKPHKKKKPAAAAAATDAPVIAEAAAPQGDCIDCMACVNVCPMGIDIRDGQQMECITCGLCIDACDDVMEKIGKPRGLIDYLALTDETAEQAGKEPKSVWKHIFRPRTILYTTLWSLVGVALVVALFIRADIELTVAPVRNPVYVTLSDGSIRNTYDVRLRNKNGDDRPFKISIKGHPTLRLQLEGTPYDTVDVPADTMSLQRVYVVAPKGSEPALSERMDLRIWVEDISNGDRAYKDTLFNGKGN
ncbi:MAG: 4Fe-4S dicluster domain-containing protein, partial [Pseudomonadota bacterium]|nr:4Fe-4S dicluster domain-containing protein [Pseudomonadota bacterium]